MASKNGNAAADEARGALEFDLLASGVDRENNSKSELTQAASSITVTVRGPAAPKGFVYSPAKTRKYEAHGRLAAQLAMGDKPATGSRTGSSNSFDDIVDHCCYAWNTLIDQPWKIMFVARRDWATVGYSM